MPTPFQEVQCIVNKASLLKYLLHMKRKYKLSLHFEQLLVFKSQVIRIWMLRSLIWLLLLLLKQVRNWTSLSSCRIWLLALSAQLLDQIESLSRDGCHRARIVFRKRDHHWFSCRRRSLLFHNLLLFRWLSWFSLRCWVLRKFWKRDFFVEFGNISHFLLSEHRTSSLLWRHWFLSERIFNDILSLSWEWTHRDRSFAFVGPLGPFWWWTIHHTTFSFLNDDGQFSLWRVIGNDHLSWFLSSRELGPFKLLILLLLSLGELDLWSILSNFFDLSLLGGLPRRWWLSSETIEAEGVHLSGGLHDLGRCLLLLGLWLRARRRLLRVDAGLRLGQVDCILLRQLLRVLRSWEDAIDWCLFHTYLA